jgi:Piwi domain
MTIFEAVELAQPRLSFSKDVPSHTGPDAWKGLNQYGPFDNTRIVLGAKSVLFVFPETLREQARKLARGLEGHKGFRGVETMFRVPFSGTTMDYLAFDADLSSPAAAAASYREAIQDWNSKRMTEPLVALVLIPRSDRWETERPYYEAKAAFAQLGIPTQMVTAELLDNDSQFDWSIANIALQMFAKLGGIPWLVEVPAGDDDLIIGIGRAEVRRENGRQRVFGYALSFASNGYYRSAWVFKPVATEEEYEKCLKEAVVGSLEKSMGEVDQPPRRLVLHLGKKTGRREIDAVEAAMKDGGVAVPTAYLRIDDSSNYDLTSSVDTFAPPKGLAVHLGPRRTLLQADGLSPLGPPEGPLLVELNERSTVGLDELDELVAQAFRLGHANWRGFNARSRPMTLVYGEILAGLVGYLEEVKSWNSEFLQSVIRDRPWFL